MEKKLVFILTFCLMLPSSCNIEKVDVVPTQTSTNMLFVGNSLTFRNDLPELVRLEAQNRGLLLTSEMIALPDYALEDHLNDGDVQQRINSGEFDYVIIQQGPSSQPYGRETLIEFGAVFKSLCDDNNAELAYMMVWPSRLNYETFDGVINNYRDASIINEALLCPVGDVWKTHFDETNTFDYYDSDGFHPSPLGSQIAAEVIINSLFF